MLLLLPSDVVSVVAAALSVFVAIGVVFAVGVVAAVGAAVAALSVVAAVGIVAVVLIVVAVVVVSANSIVVGAAVPAVRCCECCCCCWCCFCRNHKAIFLPKVIILRCSRKYLGYIFKIVSLGERAVFWCSEILS